MRQLSLWAAASLSLAMTACPSAPTPSDAGHDAQDAALPLGIAQVAPGAGFLVVRRTDGSVWVRSEGALRVPSTLTRIASVQDAIDIAAIRSIPPVQNRVGACALERDGDVQCFLEGFAEAATLEARRVSNVPGATSLDVTDYVNSEPNPQLHAFPAVFVPADGAGTLRFFDADGVVVDTVRDVLSYRLYLNGAMLRVRGESAYTFTSRLDTLAMASPLPTISLEAASDRYEVQGTQGEDGMAGLGCVIAPAGEVDCFLNTASQAVLGDGRGRVAGPASGRVQSLTDAVDLAIGRRNICAVTVSGSVWCWGEGTSSVPMRFDGLSEVVAMEASGAEQFCAWTASGRAFCWYFSAGAAREVPQEILFE